MPDKLISVPVSKLRESPDNPRSHFGDLSELSESIKLKGIIEPIIARRLPDGGLEIVAGHRRTRAAKLAGLKEVDVVVRELDRQEALEAAMTENTERESLDPIEVARGYQKLMDEFGLDAKKISERLGVGRSTIFLMTSLLRMAAPVQAAVAQGKLPVDGARAIGGLLTERLQLAALGDALKLAKDGAPSARAVLRLVKSKYGAAARRGASKHQRDARKSGAEVAVRRLVLPRLLTRVSELVERKHQLDETDMRTMAAVSAEGGADYVREVFQRRGLRPDRLGKVGATQLRSLVVELALAPHVVLDGEQYSPAVTAIAKAYGLSLSEIEKSVAATEAAEALFAKE